jgi:hypothetical protein
MTSSGFEPETNELPVTAATELLSLADISNIWFDYNRI